MCSDYPLAVRFAAEVLQDRFVWGEPPHRGWRATRPEWKPVSDKQVIVLAAEWLLGEYRAFRPVTRTPLRPRSAVGAAASRAATSDGSSGWRRP